MGGLYTTITPFERREREMNSPVMLEESLRLRFPSQDVVERLGADDKTYERLDEEVKEGSSSEDTVPGLVEGRNEIMGSARAPRLPLTSSLQI